MIRKILFLVCTISFTHAAKIPLFDHYPFLEKQISHVSLGSFPTPIIHVPSFSKLSRVYVKCDNLSGLLTEKGRLFGGNKVRKLEFLLSDALHKGATTMLTLGGTGSNHAVATSEYAHQLGLGCLALLYPQSKSFTVQRNLLLHSYYGTQLYDASECTMEQLYQRNASEENVYVIPMGGSNTIGVLGFVNAAF